MTRELFDLGLSEESPSRREMMALAGAVAAGGLLLWPDSTAAQGQPALARIVTVQGDAFEAALANFKERGVPRLAGMEGIRAVYVVSDAENRRYRIITFWESAGAARQAFEGMAAMRQQVQDAGMSFELEDYQVEAAETL